MEEIGVAVRSLAPYVWVRTHEESRFIGDFNQLMTRAKRKVYVWSICQGITSPEISLTGEKSTGMFAGTENPQKALDLISTMQKDEKTCPNGIVIVMRDPMMILQGPIIRQFRDYYNHLSGGQITVLFLSSELGHGPGGKNAGLPASIQKQVTVIDYGLPLLDGIGEELRGLIRSASRRNAPDAKMPKEQQEKYRAQLEKFKFTKEQYFEFSRALQGLTIEEVRVAASSCLHHLKTLDTAFLLRSKKQIISRSDILEYLDHSVNMEDVGGMDLVKDFFEDYTDCHSEEAQAFGAEPLKAVLTVGIPGCGKSLTCKAVANQWKLPLIRMDMGKVMAGIVGASESRMRQAIAQVEAVSPCVLWLDEIEKSMSGTKSSNFSDGGTMARVFGTLLTAMEEGMTGVTIMATANDISALPPELIRRFDEVFFIDLPGPDERKEIFAIQLRMKNFQDSDIDLDQVVEASENYTGHEIEKAVKRGITKAFRSEEKVLTTDLVVESLRDTKPLYDTAHENLSKMREKAQNRYRFASSWAKIQGEKLKAKQKTMDVNDIDLPDMKTEKSKSSDLDSNLLLD